jgi:hypothetical protein
MGNNRFSDGFVMGALAGGALVFLLGTDKGNKVLKLIIEEGKVGFNELMEQVDDLKKEAQELEVEEIEDEDRAAEAEAVAKQEVKTNGNGTEVKKTESTKRFFKQK